MLRWSDDAQEQGSNAAVPCLFQSNKPQRSTESPLALTLTAVTTPAGENAGGTVHRRRTVPPPISYPPAQQPEGATRRGAAGAGKQRTDESGLIHNVHDRR